MRGASSAKVQFAPSLQSALAGAKRCNCSSLYIGCSCTDQHRGANHHQEITAEEISSMLAAIPPRPDYGDWIRVASAVWSVLPMAEGCRLLAQWSPEETPGEYSAKHKTRLRQVGIGTLIHFAKQHGWRGERKSGDSWNLIFADGVAVRAGCQTPRRERKAFVVPQLRKNEAQKNAVPHIPTADSLRHAAEQMAKIKKAGWITGPSDPDAATFAAAFEIFEATPELSAAP